MTRYVWVGDEEPQRWMRGGTYLVARRIRMRIEAWDRDALDDQERDDRPLQGPRRAAHGHARARRRSISTARRADGTPVIAVDAHIRLAAPSENDGVRILRRGYSFTDGIDPTTSELDAGLFFIAFQRDPHKQFATLQRRLGTSDALNEYIQHTTSAPVRGPARHAARRLRGQRAVRVATGIAARGSRAKNPGAIDCALAIRR